MDVAVVGGSGYAGGELLRLLATHPTFKLRAVAGQRSAGQQLATVFPQLALEGEVVAADSEEVTACPLVFLATPHAASLDLVPCLLGEQTVVVDLSGSFRLAPDVFADFYDLSHTAPGLTPAAYGLPELFRDDLAGASLIATPGCYPTAALLALAPIAALVEPDSVVVTGLSGTSGAGAGLRADLHASHVLGNAAAYGVPGHRHTPEIEQGLAWLLGRREPVAVSFTPHLLPMARGLLTTVAATLRSGVERSSVRAAAEERYANEPFVQLLPEGSWPQTAHTLGANTAHLQVAVDDRTGRVVASCAIDNLTKGAAGGALQSANLACGLPEGAGLPTAAVYP